MACLGCPTASTASTRVRLISFSSIFSFCGACCSSNGALVHFKVIPGGFPDALFDFSMSAFSNPPLETLQGFSKATDSLDPYVNGQEALSPQAPVDMPLADDGGQRKKRLKSENAKAKDRAGAKERRSKAAQEVRGLKEQVKVLHERISSLEKENRELRDRLSIDQHLSIQQPRIDAELVKLEEEEGEEEEGK